MYLRWVPTESTRGFFLSLACSPWLWGFLIDVLTWKHTKNCLDDVVSGGHSSCISPCLQRTSTGQLCARGSRVRKSSQMLGPQTQQSSVRLSQPDHSHFSGLHDTASSKWLSAVIKANWSASYSPAPVIRLPVLMSHQSTEKCDLHKSHQFLCS